MRTSSNHPGWAWEYAQLANGLLNVGRQVAPFDARFIGSVTVDRPCLHHVRADSACQLLLLPAPDSGAVFVEGRRLVAGDAVLLPAAGELELLSHSLARIFVVTLSGLPAMHRARVRRPRWCPRASSRAGGLPEELALWLDSAGGANAESAEVAARRNRLRCLLDSVVLDAQSAEPEAPALPRRRMAVERVRHFIHDHLAESLTLADLCRHAHLQARSLEYGFRDLVGLSPFKYIKMLRLGEVRRRLQTSSASQLSVSEAALDCGFSHLSQFAADYKRMFLESPSATLRDYPREAPPLCRSTPWSGRASVVEGISPNNPR
jgi:AraC-like DNA-binding protein